MNRLLAAWIMAMAGFISFLCWTLPLPPTLSAVTRFTWAVLVVAVIPGGLLIREQPLPEGMRKVAAVAVMVIGILFSAFLTTFLQIIQDERFKWIIALMIGLVILVLSVVIVVPHLFPHGLNRLMAAWSVGVAAFLLVLVAFGDLSRPQEAREFAQLREILNAKSKRTTEVTSNAVWVARTTQDPELKAWAEHQVRWARCFEVLVGPSISPEISEEAAIRIIASNGVAHPKELTEWKEVIASTDKANALEQACQSKFFPGPGWLGLWVSTVGGLVAFWLTKRLKTSEGPDWAPGSLASR